MSVCVSVCMWNIIVSIENYQTPIWNFSEESSDLVYIERHPLVVPKQGINGRTLSLPEQLKIIFWC